MGNRVRKEHPAGGCAISHQQALAFELVDGEPTLGFPLVTDGLAGGTKRLAAIAKTPHRGSSQPLVLQQVQGDQLAAQLREPAEAPRFQRKLDPGKADLEQVSVASTV